MDSEVQSRWVNGVDARTLVPVSEKTLRRLAREGRIGVLKIPGVARVMYNRADVEALVSKGIQPATAKRELMEA